MQDQPLPIHPLRDWLRIERLMVHGVLVGGVDGHDAWHIIAEATIPGKYPWRLNRTMDGVLTAGQAVSAVAAGAHQIQHLLDHGQHQDHSAWAAEVDRMHDVLAEHPF